MSRELLIKELEIRTALQNRKTQNRLSYFRPYDWQKQFFKSGLDNKQRLLMAANRVGKTLSACYELALHLTGLYPDWWEGLRYSGPINAWALGVSGEQIRDVLQKELFGELTSTSYLGGGMVPDVLVGDIIRSMVPKLAKDVRVEHISGGFSKVSFKAYNQGQHSLMGSNIDFALIDEEPRDVAIWPQILTRILTGNRGKGGSVVLSFTPENGMTQIVTQFMNEIKPGQCLQTATWDDAPHLNDSAKEEILAAYPRWQKEMRSKGSPLMGEGLVFLMPEEKISERPLEEIPHYWPRIIGMDFGWEHPTALVWIAYDRDTDCMHIYDVWRENHVTPIDVGGVVRGRQDTWIPVSWPHDGFQHDKGSGSRLCDLYQQQGLNMLSANATFEDGSNGVEAGIFEMYERMRTGRLKVADHLSMWFEEYRMYHREKNKIVKLHDDILCATRYAMMMMRYSLIKRLPENEDEQRYSQSQQSTWY